MLADLVAIVSSVNIIKSFPCGSAFYPKIDYKQEPEILAPSASSYSISSVNAESYREVSQEGPLWGLSVLWRVETAIDRVSLEGGRQEGCPCIGEPLGNREWSSRRSRSEPSVAHIFLWEQVAEIGCGLQPGGPVIRGRAQSHQHGGAGGAPVAVDRPHVLTKASHGRCHDRPGNSLLPSGQCHFWKIRKSE